MYKRDEWMDIWILQTYKYNAKKLQSDPKIVKDQMRLFISIGIYELWCLYLYIMVHSERWNLMISDLDWILKSNKD